MSMEVPIYETPESNLEAGQLTESSDAVGKVDAELDTYHLLESENEISIGKPVETKDNSVVFRVVQSELRKPDESDIETIMNALKSEVIDNLMKWDIRQLKNETGKNNISNAVDEMEDRIRGLVEEEVNNQKNNVMILKNTETVIINDWLIEESIDALKEGC